MKRVASSFIIAIGIALGLTTYVESQTPVRNPGTVNLSATNPAADATGAAVPVNASYTGIDVGGNLVGLTGATLGSHNALATILVDGSGNQITSFGGGTQYTEGDTDATVTGTALLFESNTGTSALSVVSASAPLPISDAGGAITVDGTITTNLSATDNAVLDDIADGISVDSELASAAALADNTANPTIPGVAAFNMCWDGSTWDRCSGTASDTELSTAAAAADNFSNPTAGGVLAFNMCFDGTTWDRCDVATTTEATHDATLTPTSTVGGMGMLIAKDFDGSALPDGASAENDAVLPIGTLAGVSFAFLTNEAGTKELGKLEDDAHSTADYGLPVWAVRTDTLAASSGTTGDYETVKTNSLGAVWTIGDLCGSSAVQSADINLSAGTGNTEVLALSGSTIIYVCGFNWTVGGDATVQWITGTGTACATGETDKETFTTSTTIGYGIANPNSGAVQFKTAAGEALCVERSASVALTGRVTYVQR